MNRHILVALTIVLTTVANGWSQEINWHTDLERAKEQAAKEDKFVLLHFSADWCRPCKHLETFVFSSATVARAIQDRAIPVHIDTDMNPDLVKEFGVGEIPTDVVMTAKGRVIKKRRSPKDTSNYVRMMKSLDLTEAAMGQNNAAIAQKIDTILNSKKDDVATIDQQNDFIPKNAAGSSAANLPTGNAPTMQPNLPATPQVAQVANREVQSGQTPSKTTDANQFNQRVINDSFFLEKTNSKPEGKTTPPSLKTASVATKPTNTSVEMATQSSADSNSFQPKRKPSSDQSPAKIVVQGPLQPATPSLLQPVLQAAQPVQDSAVAKIVAEAPKVAADKVEQSTHAPIDNSKVLAPATKPVAPKTAGNSQPQQPTFALNGKCPVTLIRDGKWEPGDVRFGCTHRGRTYLFGSQQKLDDFRRDPESFSPLLAGFDPVVFHDTGNLVDGLEKHGAFMGQAPNQKIVLFSSPETRQKFQRNPSVYMASVRMALAESDRIK